MALSKKTFPKAAAAAAAFDPYQNFEVVTYTGNGGTQKITGYIRKGAAFNGSSSKIDTGYNLTSTTFSVSVWFNTTDSAAPIIGDYDASGTGASDREGFQLLTTKVALHKNDAEVGSHTFSSELNNGNWRHVVITNDGTTCKVYVDGSEDGTINSTTWTDVSVKDIHLGYTQRSPIVNWLNGKIDQVRIFNKALSSGEVSTLYGETYASSTKSTTDIFGDGSGVALYELDEDANDTGLTSYDLDINKLDISNATLYNPTSVGTYTQPGAQFGNNGTKIYFGYEIGGSIIQHSLSTAYDITSVTGSAVTKTLPRNLTTFKVISSTKIFIRDSDYFGEWNMSSAWDISTLTENTSNRFSITSLNAFYSGFVFRGFYFNSDGTKVMLSFTDSSGIKFQVRSLSTAYDISDLSNQTLNSESSSISFAGGLAPIGFWTDGSVILIGEIGANDYLHQINLSTAWDVSTASSTKSINVGTSLGGNPTSPEFYPEQNVLLLARESDNYIQIDFVGNFNGTATNVNFLGMAFQPDFVWIKNRTAAVAGPIFDSIRGVYKRIYPSLTNAEATNTSSLTSFDSNGFSVGADTQTNQSGGSIVAWCFKGGGTAVSNTDGSITSQVSANQDAGFSIVKYTGNGTAGATIGHGLSSTPEMVIVKAISGTDAGSTNWHVYTPTTGATKTIMLNSSAAASTNSLIWNNTAPTSTVFSVANNTETNGTSSQQYIAYCFHSVDGYQKIGSYTGTGVNGNSITTGFQPRFVMIKSTTTSPTSWVMIDSLRDNADEWLYANESSSTYDDANTYTQLDSNGFTVNDSASYVNASGHTYIYLAIA